MLEINVVDGRADLACLTIAVSGRAFEQELEDVLIGPKQVAAGDVGDAGDCLFDLFVVHPVVDFGERLAQFLQQDDIIE